MAEYIFKTDDKEEAELHLKAPEYKICLWNLDQWLRNHVKYNHEKLSGPQIDILEKTRQELRDLLINYNISLD
jgi:hypothetical protein